VIEEHDSQTRWDTLALIWSVGLIVALPVMFSAAGIAPHQDDAMSLVLLGILTFHLPPLLVVMITLARRVPKGERRSALALSMPERPIRDTLAAVLVIFPCIALILLAMNAMGVEPKPAPYVEWLQYGKLPIVVVLVLAAVVVAPITEELLFRQVMNGVLERKLGRHAAMHITALVFASCHMRPTQIPVLYVVALVLQYLRNSRGSLLSSIFAHAFYNGVMIGIGLYVLRVVQG
jgi:membrane protease YdiL (CAAX protease family)